MESNVANENKKEGVYLSNFVATSAGLFVIVLAFAAGFFLPKLILQIPGG